MNQWINNKLHESPLLEAIATPAQGQAAGDFCQNKQRSLGDWKMENAYIPEI